MENVVSLKKRNKKKPLFHAKRADVRNDIFEGLSGPIESKHLLISMLLPPAVKAFLKELESEVDQVCGELSYIVVLARQFLGNPVNSMGV